MPGCQRHRGHFQLKLAAKHVLSLEDHYKDQEGTCGSRDIIPVLLSRLCPRYMDTQALGMGIVGSALIHLVPPSISVASGSLRGTD